MFVTPHAYGFALFPCCLASVADRAQGLQVGICGAVSSLGDGDYVVHITSGDDSPVGLALPAQGLDGKMCFTGAQP